MRVIVLAAAIAAVSASGPLWRAAWPHAAVGLRFLEGVAADDPAAAMALYVGTYALLAAVALPVGPVLNMAAGALFGAWMGTASAVAAATLGSLLLFLMARGTIGRAVARRQAPLVARLRPRLARGGLAAIVALRIAPLAPAWLVTLAAAITGLRTGAFALGTALGLVPTTAVLATAGMGLGRALTGAEPPDLSLLWRPSILLPLLGLAVLVAVPQFTKIIPWRMARGS